MLDSNDHYFFEKECTSWLSSNQDEVDRYHGDEYCGFQFTVSAYLDFFRILMKLAQNKGITKIPKRLPILLLSGRDDAIGEFGKGVTRVYEPFTIGKTRLHFGNRFYPDRLLHLACRRSRRRYGALRHG